MADSDDAGEPGDLAGWHGDNWCVYPSMFGPPDQVDEFVMRWLVIPGPPMSCTLVLQLGSPVPNNERYAYHKHLNTWSIHVCIAGKGKHYAEGNVSEVVPGTIFYEAPGAVHTTAPDPGHSLLQACIQYPILGYENETKVVPEAGTLERWGDLQEFIKLFGPDGEKYKKATAGMFKSERWLKYVTNRRR